MILNFKYNKANNTITWHFKAQNQKIQVVNPQIVRCYEYLDRIFVITLENNNSVLYVYSPEGEINDRIESTKEFFISGIREGIITPEFVIRSKGNPPTIYTYDIKKKRFINTGEIIPQNYKRKQR